MTKDMPIILAQSDFKIPAPKTSEPVTAKPETKSTAPTTIETNTTISFDSLVGRPVSTTEIAVGGATFVVLLVLFFVAKISVTRGLQTRYAAPGAASEAGWMLFIWLSVTALCAIVAVVGNLWSQIALVGPAALASLVLLILFLRKRSHALATRR